jgi:hypothetical protein
MRQPLHEMRVSAPLLLASALVFSSAPSTFVQAAASNRVVTASGVHASIERYPLYSRRTQENQDAVRPKLRRLFFDKFSNEGETPPPPIQRKIQTFALVLSPTPDVVTLLEESLHGAVVQTIQSYMKKQTEDLEYVYLADIAHVSRSDESATQSALREWMEEKSTTIVFSGGVASFTETAVQHPASQINAWVQEALENDLLAVFATNFSEQYGSITKASYVSLSDAPSMEPTSALVDEPIIGEVNSASTVKDTKGRMRYSVIVAVALGAAFFVLAIAMLIKKQRQNNAAAPAEPLAKDAVVFVDDAVTDVDDAETDNGDATSDITEIESEVAHYRHRGDIAALGGGGSGNSTGSLAGSSVGGLSAPEELTDGVSVTSEWTLSTVEESMFASDRRQINNSWAVAENFYRDRQVNISKDMLHGVWSGRQQPAPAATPAAAPRSTRGDFSSWRTEQGDSPAFVFEQANGGGASEGEEVFFMPPSRVTSTVETDTATL